jgi:hypothetical protein
MRWFFDHFIVSRIESKDFNLIFILVELWLHLAHWRVRQDFSTTYEDSIGSIFQHGRRDIISEPQENKMQLKFCARPTGKYHSAYSPYALNGLNLALTQWIWAQNEKDSRSFLSIQDRMQWAK